MIGNFLLYVNTGESSKPKWELIKGNHRLELTTRGGLKNWSIHLSESADDKGYKILERAFERSKEVNIKIQYPDGKIQIGWGSLVDFSINKEKIECTGPLSKKMPEEPYTEHLKQIMSEQDYERLIGNS